MCLVEMTSSIFNRGILQFFVFFIHQMRNRTINNRWWLRWCFELSCVRAEYLIVKTKIPSVFLCQPWGNKGRKDSANHNLEYWGCLVINDGGGGVFFECEDFGRISTIHSPPALFFFFFKVEISSRTLVPIFRWQWLSKLRRLWPSVHWRVACELVSW